MIKLKLNLINPAHLNKIKVSLISKKINNNQNNYNNKINNIKIKIEVSLLNLLLD